MPNSLLSLGAFSFLGLESPESIHLKSEQRLTIHHLGSGHATIDYLGDDYETVSFRGVFSGPQAADRIRSIDRLRLLGLPLILAWNSRTLSVIIKQLELDYSSDRWVRYRLSCFVVRSAGISTGDPADVLSVSPGTQISDMCGLLRNTGINPTASQADAILTLAALSFDTPPPDALVQARALVNSINSDLATLGNLSQDALSSDQEPGGGIVSGISALINDCGQQAALILGRNRALSVITCAEEGGQR